MARESKFEVADFIVFFGMLLLSFGIGLFYALRDRKKKSTDNYYYGGRNMSPIPIGLSLAVTFISSIAVLAYPNHAYVYGSVVIWFGVSTIVQVIVACLYYIPLYHRLQLSSVYEYLELRFHAGLRKLCSLVAIISFTFYMSTTLYLTALALSALTPLEIEWNIIISAGICTFYTSLGGVKAVVWADSVQAFIMVAGSVAVLIKSTILVGGFGKVMEAVERGGRNTLWNFNPDPQVSHTFWTIFVGMGLTWTKAACVNQGFTQRYNACKTERDAKIALIISAIPMSFLLIISALNGLVMYAYFEGCDPSKAGRIDKIDQTVALLVGEIFDTTPGMAGLFVASAYSGTLSTLSSGINFLSALILEDFITAWKPNLKEIHRLTISKCLGIILGILTTATVFLIQILGTTVVQIAVTVIGLHAGPILGVFTVGIFLPWTNCTGAAVGLVSGLAMSLWITVGGIVYGPNPAKNQKLPLSISNCTVDATTGAYDMTTSEVAFASTSSVANFSMSTSVIVESRPPIADSLYSLSYLYIGSVGLLVTCVTAVLLSFATGKNDPKKMDPKLFVPFIDNKHLPEKVRKFFRFGVPEIPTDSYQERCQLHESHSATGKVDEKSETLLTL